MTVINFVAPFLPVSVLRLFTTIFIVASQNLQFHIVVLCFLSQYVQNNDIKNSKSLISQKMFAI